MSHVGPLEASGPFDFSLAMRRLCEDVCTRLEPFRHIRMDEVAVTFAQARRRVPHGLQAKLTPMRFENGQLTTTRGRRRWTVQRLYAGAGEDRRELLYILTFYLPRFLDHDLREKLVTVLHELFHISPLFEGVAEAVEESIANALTAAETMVGYKGRTAHAIPLDELQRVMEKYRP